MATSTQNDDGSVTLDDGSGHQKTIAVVPSTVQGWAEIHVFDGPDTAGAFVGTPHRLKMTNSGGRIAGDSPGVNAGEFITQPGTLTNPLAGQIANG